MKTLDIIHHFPTEGNLVYMKQHHIPKGYYVVSHAHAYDHFGILAQGTVILELDGDKTRHQGVCVIEIKSGKKHKITALEETDWFCVHGTIETDPEKIDETLIMEANHAI